MQVQRNFLSLELLRDRTALGVYRVGDFKELPRAIGMDNATGEWRAQKSRHQGGRQFGMSGSRLLCLFVGAWQKCVHCYPQELIIDAYNCSYYSIAAEPRNMPLVAITLPLRYLRISLRGHPVVAEIRMGERFEYTILDKKIPCFS